MLFVLCSCRTLTFSTQVLVLEYLSPSSSIHASPSTCIWAVPYKNWRPVFCYHMCMLHLLYTKMPMQYVLMRVSVSSLDPRQGVTCNRKCIHIHGWDTLTLWGLNAYRCNVTGLNVPIVSRCVLKSWDCRNPLCITRSSFLCLGLEYWYCIRLLIFFIHNNVQW